MQEAIIRRPDAKSKYTSLISNLSVTLFGLLSVFIFGALILGADRASAHVKNALLLCVNSVIPSVFPIAVISGILSMGQIGEFFSKALGKIICPIFRVSERASLAVLLGFLCGFPIGALTAARLYKRGVISAAELSHLLTFVNNPGASFVIYCVGGELLGSVTLGITVYSCVIISSVAAGIIGGKLSAISAIDNHAPPLQPMPISALIVTSVSSAASGAVNICAYASFFSAVAGILSSLLVNAGLSPITGAILSGFFEIVSGTAALSDCASPLFNLLAVSSACSWSGISVIMQIVSVCRDHSDGENVSFAPMVISKLMQAVLCPILVLIAVYVFKLL